MALRIINKYLDLSDSNVQDTTTDTGITFFQEDNGEIYVRSLTVRLDPLNRLCRASNRMYSSQENAFFKFSTCPKEGDRLIKVDNIDIDKRLSQLFATKKAAVYSNN